jgi:hypothetical protein
MTWMRSSRTRAVIAMISMAALLPLAAAPVAARDSAKAEHDRTIAYWTKERIEKAIPREFVKSGSAYKLNPNARPNRPPTGGGGVTGASWTSGGPILARSGRVVFTMAGSDWICSGSVVDDSSRPGYSMVLTAGHCAIDETTGQFATRWTFIPAFDTAPTYDCASTALPYGCWTATALVVRKEFATAGSFNDTAVANDWAFAIVGPGGKSGSAQLDATVGTYPIAFATATNSPVVKGDKLYSFGYPAAGKYHGKDLVYCAGAIIEDAGTSNLTWGMPCNMTGGSSGGPWLSNFESGTTTLSSVNSYGYSGQSVMYGPKFNVRTSDTWAAAKTATTTNQTVPN